MPKRFSEADARRIFALAAERQHEAGQEEPGLTLEELEEVGRAAGLDPAFVREAAADALRPEPVRLTRTVLGVPTEIRRERFVRGEVTDEAWAQVVMDLRQRFNKAGVVTEIGPVREWRSVAGDNRQAVVVTLTAERDGTRAVVERTQTQMALGFGIGTGTNALMGLLFLLFSLVETGTPGLIVPAMVLLGFAALFGAGSYIGMRRHGRRQAESFEAALDRIDLAVRDARPLAETSPEAVAPEALPPLDLSALGPEAENGAPGQDRARTRA